jgi:Beta-lactamase superfamily domain
LKREASRRIVDTHVDASKPRHRRKHLVEGASENGSIAWMGYSTVVIASGRTRIIFDPLGMTPETIDEINFDRESLKLPSESSTLVCLSHEHLDHLDSVSVEKLRCAGAKVIGPPATIRRLPAGARASCSPVSPGDDVSIGDLRVKVCTCKHTADGPVSYLVTMPDGIRIYYPHDSDPMATMIEFAGHSDPLVLCWVGSSMEKCVGIARLVGADVVLYPSYSGRHYDEYAAKAFKVAFGDKSPKLVSMTRANSFSLYGE